MRGYYSLFVVLALCLSMFLTINGDCMQPASGEAASINSTVDLQRYNTCTFLPGLIIGQGNITGDIYLPNLTSITAIGGNKADIGLIITNSAVTSVSIPNLQTVYSGSSSTLRVTNNPQLTTINIPGPISFTGSPLKVTFANNTALISTTFGIVASAAFTLGGDAASVSTDGIGGTAVFPHLASVNGAFNIISNGLNPSSGANALVSLSFPVLNSVTGTVQIIANSVQTFSAPASSGIAISTNLLVNNNTKLTSFTFNVKSVQAVTFNYNGQSGQATLYNFVANALTGGINALTVTSNYGLGVLTLPFNSSTSITITGNPDLTQLNLPGPIYIANTGASVNFVGNGGTSGMAATLGFQTIAGTTSITGNTFTSLTFPELYLVYKDFLVSANTFTGPVTISTSAGFLGLFQITGSLGGATAYNLGGIFGAQQFDFTSNLAASGAVLDLSGLQGVNSTAIINQNSIAKIVFGNLRAFNSTVEISENGALTNITSSGPYKYITRNTVTISNNVNLATVDLSGLVQATTLTITVATGSTQSLASLNAPDLSCVGKLTVAGISSSVLLTLTGLKYFNNLDIPSDPNAAQQCTVVIGNLAPAKCSDQSGSCNPDFTPNYGSKDTTAATDQSLCSTNPLNQTSCTAPSPTALPLPPADLVLPPTTTTTTNNTNTNTNGTTTDKNSTNSPSGSGSNTGGSAIVNVCISLVALLIVAVAL